MCPDNRIYVSSYYICILAQIEQARLEGVQSLQYMCPMCPHNCFFCILAQIEQARLEGVQSLPQQIAALEGQVQLKAHYTSSLRPHTLEA